MFKFFPIPIIILSEYLNGAWVPPPANMTNYDAYDSLIAVNEQIIILAQNDIQHFQIIVNPFTNSSRRCSSRYISVKHGLNSYTDYIYSVAIGSKQETNGTEFYFAFIGEDRFRDVFVTIIYFDISNSSSNCVSNNRFFDFNVTDLAFSEQVIIGMDPNGNRVYAVGFHYILVIDVKTRMSRTFTRYDVFGEGSFGFLPPHVEAIHTFSKALSISEDHHLYIVGQRHHNFQYLAYLHVLNFEDLSHNELRLISDLILSPFNFGSAAQGMSRFSSMSIFLNEEQQMLIIGIPHLDTVLLLSLNPPAIIKRHESSQKGVSFGKSVALFPDNSYAVLVSALSTLPWSTSQVQVYTLNDTSNDPLFTFPNNQQVIRTMNLIEPPYGILTLVSSGSNIALVVEAGGLLLLPSSPPGYCSSRIDDNLLYAGSYTSQTCPAGTARNTSGFGPCLICSPHTKNNGSSGVNCESCSTNMSLLCLRGAKTEFDLDRVSNFDQANPYPHSPETREFDDVLLQNLFVFWTTSGYCLIISPFFWTTLIIGLSLIVSIVIAIWTCSPQRRFHRTLLKKILTRFDLIGHGELWLGGIVSLASIILIGLTCNFSASFSYLYPIEKISSESHRLLSCDSDLLNSKFTSALQLLSIHKHQRDKPMFQLLDEQKINLNAEFVSTDFSCENVTMQQNIDKEQQISFTEFDCLVDKEVNILSLSTLLSQHLITIQFNLQGSSFVGGFRLCLNAPSTTQGDGKYTVRALNFCQFFFTPNETLATNTVINVKMTKSINRTAPLSFNDNIILTGLWLPTVTVNTLANAFRFEQGGKYRRYLSDRIILVIDLTESEFYIKNTQEPMARQNQIAFHTILFSMLCLDLISLLFIFYKLTIIPVVRIVTRRYFHVPQIVNLIDKQEQLELTQFIRQHIDQAINQWKLSKTVTNGSNILSIDMNRNSETRQSNQLENTQF